MQRLLQNLALALTEHSGQLNAACSMEDSGCEGHAFSGRRWMNLSHRGQQAVHWDQPQRHIPMWEKAIAELSTQVLIRRVKLHRQRNGRCKQSSGRHHSQFQKRFLASRSTSCTQMSSPSSVNIMAGHPSCCPRFARRHFASPAALLRCSRYCSLCNKLPCQHLHHH